MVLVCLHAAVPYVMSKSVEVPELSEGAFARLVEIEFSKRPFASLSNKAFSFK